MAFGVFAMKHGTGRQFKLLSITDPNYRAVARRQALEHCVATYDASADLATCGTTSTPSIVRRPLSAPARIPFFKDIPMDLPIVSRATIYKQARRRKPASASIPPIPIRSLQTLAAGGRTISVPLKHLCSVRNAEGGA